MILITDLFSILVLLIHIVTIIFPFPIYDSHNQTPVLHPGFVHQPERLVQVVVVQDLVKVFIFLFSNIYEEVVQSAMTKRCFDVDFHSCG